MDNEIQSGMADSGEPMAPSIPPVRARFKRLLQAGAGLVALGAVVFLVTRGFGGDAAANPTGKAAAAQTWMFDNGAGERQALHLVHQQNAVGIVFRTAAPFRPPFIEITGNQADFWFRELVIRELPEEASAPAPPAARE